MGSEKVDRMKKLSLIKNDGNKKTGGSKKQGGKKTGGGKKTPFDFSLPPPPPPEWHMSTSLIYRAKNRQGIPCVPGFFLITFFMTTF